MGSPESVERLGAAGQVFLGHVVDLLNDGAEGLPDQPMDRDEVLDDGPPDLPGGDVLGDVGQRRLVALQALLQGPRDVLALGRLHGRGVIGQGDLQRAVVLLRVLQIAEHVRGMDLPAQLGFHGPAHQARVGLVLPVVGVVGLPDPGLLRPWAASRPWPSSSWASVGARWCW